MSAQPTPPSGTGHGWEILIVSQSGAIGTMREGRAFVALINLNREKGYKVTVRARRAR